MQKWIVALGVCAVIAMARPAPARACGVVNLGGVVADVAQNLAGRSEDVSTPLVLVGGGKSEVGSALSASLGWGWGKRQRGGMFPGTSINRVLVDITHTDRTRVAATYGVYNTTMIPIGLDAGLVADATGVGPVGRFTLAMRGVGVRLSGGGIIGQDPRLIGTVELVVDGFALADQI